MRKPTKLDRLREQIGPNLSLDEIERIARSIGAWEDRFAARPAAEMLIAEGDPAARQMQSRINDLPFTGTDHRAELLRSACKVAMMRDGIPPRVAENARRFYGGEIKAQPAPTDRQQGGGFSFRKLFRRG